MLLETIKEMSRKNEFYKLTESIELLKIIRNGVDNIIDFFKKDIDKMPNCDNITNIVESFLDSEDNFIEIEKYALNSDTICSFCLFFAQYETFKNYAFDYCNSLTFEETIKAIYEGIEEDTLNDFFINSILMSIANYIVDHREFREQKINYHLNCVVYVLNQLKLKITKYIEYIKTCD